MPNEELTAPAPTPPETHAESAAENALTLRVPQAVSMWNDTKLMNQAWRTATMLSKSTIIPQSYRDKPGDCLILLDLSARMGLSPITIAQYSQVVQGQFTWKGQACKAFVDAESRYSRPSKYVMVGEEGTPSWGCFLRAYGKDGETVDGPTVTIQTAINEGWYNKNGSKWKTMPELMLKYRAAAFFARTECPQSLMGFQTADEVMDLRGYEPEAPGVTVITLDDV